MIRIEDQTIYSHFDVLSQYQYNSEMENLKWHIRDFQKELKIEFNFSDFESKMKNRLYVGFFRYVLKARESCKYTDYLNFFRVHLKNYEKYKNKEFLIDAANMVFFEYNWHSFYNVVDEDLKKHPYKFFIQNNMTLPFIFYNFSMYINKKNKDYLRYLMFGLSYEFYNPSVLGAHYTPIDSDREKYGSVS